MKSFGIAALVIAIASIFIPIVGAFFAGLAGVLAFFSAGKGTSLGLAAVIVNIVNVCFMSPTLIITASYQASNQISTASELQYTAAFVILLLIQIVAILIFIGKWVLAKRAAANT